MLQIDRDLPLQSIWITTGYIMVHLPPPPPQVHDDVLPLSTMMCYHCGYDLSHENVKKHPQMCVHVSFHDSQLIRKGSGDTATRWNLQLQANRV